MRTKSPADMILPVSVLDAEFHTWERPFLPDLSWVGVRLYQAVLESA